MSETELRRFSFFGNFIGGVIVASAATILLGALIIKGYTTNTLAQYSLVYFMLFNMIIIWTCQIAAASVLVADDQKLPLS
jgi:hypothetical protein